MGLDAFVHCRCAIDAVASPPPEPFSLTVDGLVADDPVDDQSFDAWLRGGCPHVEMLAAAEHVANWRGCRILRRALLMAEPAGANDPASLATTLPERNGGVVAPWMARRHLAELDRFAAAPVTWTRTTIVDDDGEAIVASTTFDEEFQLLSSPLGSRVVLTNGGLVVESTPPQSGAGAAADPLFSATQFRQAEVTSTDGSTHWRWESSDDQFISEVPLRAWDDAGQRPPARSLTVTSTEEGPASLRPVVERLRNLFRTSVDTGMPVHWC